MYETYLSDHPIAYLFSIVIFLCGVRVTLGFITHAHTAITFSFITYMVNSFWDLTTLEKLAFWQIPNAVNILRPPNEPKLVCFMVACRILL